MLNIIPFFLINIKNNNIIFLIVTIFMIFLYKMIFFTIFYKKIKKLKEKFSFLVILTIISNIIIWKIYLYNNNILENFIFLFIINYIIMYYNAYIITSINTKFLILKIIFTTILTIVFLKIKKIYFLNYIYKYIINNIVLKTHLVFFKFFILPPNFFIFSGILCGIYFLIKKFFYSKIIHKNEKKNRKNIFKISK